MSELHGVTPLMFFAGKHLHKCISALMLVQSLKWHLTCINDSILILLENITLDKIHIKSY